jgi:phosphoribosylformylglycinamidine synthase
MLAGGLGAIDAAHAQKAAFPPGTLLIQLGGPGLLIGMGGGAASSMGAGANVEDLDFDSVQRGNPEMQRRAQEVIDRCWQLGDANPILSRHDVGAGGLSNALPELAHGAGRGARLELRDVPSLDSGMSPREIWSNEAQERYVLAVAPGSLELFRNLCERERCPFAVLGEATEEGRLLVTDRHFGNKPVDIDLSVILGQPPRMLRDVRRERPGGAPLALDAMSVERAAHRVIRHPAVAAKHFLVSIGDRTVGGLCSRDPFVGPWQVPVADCAVTLADFKGCAGEAMAMGERTPLALIDAPASGRMAVGEAITNLAAARIASLSQVKLSANWMAAAGHPGEDAAFFDTVKAVALELCPALGVSIPVGKDSLSMQAQWHGAGIGETAVGTRQGEDQGSADPASQSAASKPGEMHTSVSPVSLVVTAFAPVPDVRAQLTPLLSREADTEIWLIGLGAGRQRLGGSILSPCFDACGGAAPDLDDPQRLLSLFELVRDAREAGLLLAYHDRSDGGAFTALCEMAFCSHLGLDISLEGWGGDRADDVCRTLFNEELGAIVQISGADRAEFADLVARHGLIECAQRIARPSTAPSIRVIDDGKTLVEWHWEALFDAWWSTSHAMQRLRDDPACADEERAAARRFDAPGLQPKLTFDPAEDVAAQSTPASTSTVAGAPSVNAGAAPRVAILREQGVNGQVEMASAFVRSGFEAVDVHMSDLIAGRADLSTFAGLVACGGFSYGDVLGAGRGWATSILERAALREAFERFFARGDTFSLGVCNGCQMMSQLRDIIPGAAHWPQFLRNRSEQFEARFGMLEVVESPSLFFGGMAGSRIPVAIAHGEGRAAFAVESDRAAAHASLRYVQGDGSPAIAYPANPNGSTDAIAGLCSSDGRATIVMPHPERTPRTANLSWAPADWPDDSPWLRMFRNVRKRMS